VPDAKASKAAGYHDVSDWGEKDTSGAYPPGTKFDLGDGKPVDVTKVPDAIGRRRAAKRARRRWRRA
jgi:hypothetical protein